MPSRNVQVGIAVVIALVVTGFFFLFTNFASFVSEDISLESTANNNERGELVVQDETEGTGEQAAAGDTVTVNYTGRFQDGTVFDTSVGRGAFSFTLGAGEVISGWDQGVAGMQVGGKRILIVPPHLGYGAGGYPPVIPPNSTLVFEVELLGVEKNSQ